MVISMLSNLNLATLVLASIFMAFTASAQSFNGEVNFSPDGACQEPGGTSYGNLVSDPCGGHCVTLLEGADVAVSIIDTQHESTCYFWTNPNCNGPFAISINDVNGPSNGQTCNSIGLPTDSSRSVKCFRGTC